MRRTAALFAAVALVATGVAVAAPAGAAALKPGVPTAVKAVPTAKGTVNVTWKAPVVKKGKTAKATSYTVVCTGAKKVTVKATRATVVMMKISDPKYTGHRENSVCAVNATAGKAVGKAAKSLPFTAYYQLAVARFTLNSATVTAIGPILNALAPAKLNAATHTFTFPIVNELPAVAPATVGTMVIAGALQVGPLPLPKMTIVPDPAFTAAAPVFDIKGIVIADSNKNDVVLTLDNYVANDVTKIDTFDVKLTTNGIVVGALNALAGSAVATPGMLLGTGTLSLS